MQYNTINTKLESKKERKMSFCLTLHLLTLDCYVVSEGVKLSNLVFTMQCTAVQCAVLLSHIVCPSVCLSVTLVDHEHIG